MKIETLKDRIEKAKAKIEKKSGTIVKKTAFIEKKYAALRKLGVVDPENQTREDYRHLSETDDARWFDISWTYGDIKYLFEDIERLEKEIEETKKTLEKYEAQLTGEIAKEEILLNEIPDIFNNLRDELVATWDKWDIARRERIKKDHNELGYEKFWKKYTRSDWEFMYKTETQIHDANVQDAKILILDLYYRVKSVTGEVTDWTHVHATAGTHGFTVLNGIVIGKEGRAKVESILAGGYNIQRLHVRVLVHSI